MTSKLPAPPREAFVWVWLPNQTEPVVADRLVAADDTIDFVYGRIYQARSDALALYLPELPLKTGFIRPLERVPEKLIDFSDKDTLHLFKRRAISYRLADSTQAESALTGC